MKFAVGILVAVCIAVIVSITAAFVFRGLTPSLALFSLAAGVAGGCAAGWKSKPAQGAWERPGIWAWFTIVVGILFALRSFLWLVFNVNDDVRFLSPNNPGDLALHLTYINYVASGVRFWPENPIFAGTQLHYPVGIDLFNSLLVLAGMNVNRSLVWAGLIGAGLSGLALYRWGGAFTLAAFLFNGGIAAFGTFKGWHFVPGLIKSGALADYQADLAWKSLPLAMLVTQRGILYALPAGLILLTTWRHRCFPEAETDDPPAPIIPRWCEVLLYSTMPLFHFHTFLFLSLLLAFWMIMGSARTRMSLAWLVGVSLVPGTVCVSLVTGLFLHSRVSPAPPASGRWMDVWFAKHGMPFHVAPGWMQENTPFVAFWFNNFGLLPVLAGILLLVILLTFRASQSARTAFGFVVPSLLIFLFCCYISLAPWEWDNTKVMIWCYLATMPFLWRLLLAPRQPWQRAIACFLLFFSGFVSLLGGIDGSHTGYNLAKRSDLDGVSQAVRGIPINETFASFPTYNHPLLLIGRKVAVGYPGHLRSHGINYEPREDQLRLLMLGVNDWRAIARELHVRYLFWGEPEESSDDYQASTKPWQGECKLVTSGEWGELYDLESPSEHD